MADPCYASRREAGTHPLRGDFKQSAQARLGDFPKAVDEAVMASSEAHRSQMMQYLNSKELQAAFQRVVFDMLVAKRAKERSAEK